MNGKQGQLGLYVETLSQTRTEKETSFLSFPIPSSPYLSFKLQMSLEHMGLSKVYVQSLLVLLPLIFRSQVFALLGIVLQQNVRESWFQSYESLWHRDAVRSVMGTSSTLGQNNWKNSHGYSLCCH